MAFLLMMGITSISKVAVKLFPEVVLDQVQIQVVYPGASPTEIEESIIRRIEEKIASVEEIQEVKANALEGMATITVELLRGADTQKRLDEIKSAVDQIITFPVDAEKPQVRALSTQQRALQIVVAGATSEKELKELANRMKDDLTFKSGISIVNISGTREYEISIEASSDALRSQNLTLTDISAAIRNGSVELPGGEIETPTEELVLRTLGRNYNQKDFEEIVIATGANGSQILLSDVATVNDHFADTDLINLYNGVPAVMVNVMRIGDEQVLEIEETVQAYLKEELQPSLPKGVVAILSRNDASSIRDRLSVLIKNAVMGLILVLITLTLFLELRVAIWTSLGILISFVGVFAVMRYLNVSVNVLSSMGFLIAIGIVVDDAIVVGENIFARYQAGMSPLQAAIKGAQRIALPVVFAVATTVAAFSSLLSLPGAMGSLLGDIPMIVIGVLMLSVIEALLVLPFHLSHVSGKAKIENFFTRGLDKIHKKIGHIFQRFVDGPLDKALKFSTIHPWVIICAATSLLFITVGIMSGGHVKFNFFPVIEGKYVTANIELPTGATVERTEIVVARLEQGAIEVGEQFNSLMGDNGDLIRSMTLIVGAQEGASASPMGTPKGSTQSNVATVIVELAPPELRGFPSSDFEEAWRSHMGAVPEARKLTFSSEDMGFGDPVYVELTATNEEVLPSAISEIEQALRQFNGVFDVRNNRDTGKREITVSLKPQARVYGLTLESLAFQVRAAFFGDESLRVQRGREDIRVYVRLPKNERSAVSDLDNYRIKTPEGGFVPLSEVAELKEGISPSTIQRRDGRRIIAVSANIDSHTITSSDVNDYISNTLMPQLQTKYPGLTYDFGGEQREQARTGPAIIMNCLYALIAIYAMLAIVFKSYIQPLIVLTVIPFGVFGAIVGHLIMGVNMSLISIFGIIGLSGVIINGALVMIDFMNEERANGRSAIDAIVVGAKGRFRPIFLTSTTTFLGVGPLIFETSLQAQFLVPVAISIGFGVIFGTAILLLLVPALMSLYSMVQKDTEVDHAMDHSGQIISDFQEG